MRMMPYYNQLSHADKNSIGLAYGFIAILAALLAFIAYFVCCKSKQLLEFKKIEIEERNLKRTIQIHWKILALAQVTNQDLPHAKKVLLECISERKKLIKRSIAIRGAQFTKYAPLLENVCFDDTPAATYGALTIAVRRCVMLFMAMFVQELQWLQL